MGVHTRDLALRDASQVLLGTRVLPASALFRTCWVSTTVQASVLLLCKLLFSSNTMLSMADNGSLINKEAAGHDWSRSL